MESESEESESFHFLPMLFKPPSFTYTYLVKTRLSEKKTKVEEHCPESNMCMIGYFASSAFASDSGNLAFIRS